VIDLVVVDDHPLVREGIGRVIERTRDVRMIASFSDGDAFLRQARALSRIDVVLLDVAMPHSDGMEVLTRLRSWGNPPRVLMLSMHPERTHARQAMRAGAHGYLTKDVDDQTLLTAIRTIAAGGTYLSPDAHAYLLTPETPANSNSLATLSDQERRVFTLLRLGLTVKEIARDLDVAANTVTTYKARLMQKLGAKSLVDLLRFGDDEASS
jgi:DNA-binding NarL/FixJ family response regulator